MKRVGHRDQETLDERLAWYASDTTLALATDMLFCKMALRLALGLKDSE